MTSAALSSAVVRLINSAGLLCVLWFVAAGGAFLAHLRGDGAPAAFELCKQLERAVAQRLQRDFLSHGQPSRS